MRITIRKKKRTDFMGSVTTVTTTVIEDAEEVDVLRLLGGTQLDAYTSFPRPADTRAIAVSEAMRAAGRAVFLSPERIAALRDTLDEVYRAMERARRNQR